MGRSLTEEAYLPGAFKGNEEFYNFDCPDIDPSISAVLMFETIDVDTDRNVFEINSSPVPGGIPISTPRDSWNGNIMLTGANVLRETGNVLHIKSLTGGLEASGAIDDFVIDNVVVLYKTKGTRPTGVGTSPGAEVESKAIIRG